MVFFDDAKKRGEVVMSECLKIS